MLFTLIIKTTIQRDLPFLYYFIDLSHLGHYLDPLHKNNSLENFNWKNKSFCLPISSSLYFKLKWNLFYESCDLFWLKNTKNRFLLISKKIINFYSITIIVKYYVPMPTTAKKETYMEQFKLKLLFYRVVFLFMFF